MAVELRRINHVTVNAPSGEQNKVREFFGNILGLKEVQIPQKVLEIYEVMWFELLDILLHIEFTKNYERPKEGYENGAVLPGRHLAIEVKNIQQVRKHFEERGVAIREAVAIPDRDRFYCIDPFGNFFEIIEFHKDQEKM